MPLPPLSALIRVAACLLCTALLPLHAQVRAPRAARQVPAPIAALPADGAVQVASVADVLSPDVRAALVAARAAGGVGVAGGAAGAVGGAGAANAGAVPAQVPVYLVLRDQLSAQALTEASRDLPPRARRAAIVQQLQAHAAQSNAQVRAVLSAAQAAGRAGNVQVLWMGNALVFAAQPDVIEALATLPGIDRIRLDIAPDPASVQDAAPATLAPAPRAPAPLPLPPPVVAPVVVAPPVVAPVVIAPVVVAPVVVAPVVVAPVVVAPVVVAPVAPAPAAPSGSAPYPFADDFESGVLLPWWTAATTGAGYVSVTSANGPLGVFHAVMASSTDGTDGTASLTLCLDLAGESDVGIRFRHKSFADDPDAQDGVFVSADGINYQLALSLQNGSASYAVKTINLDQVAAGLGLSYTSTFFVRFQWKDNFNIPSDGFGFDGIEIGPGLYVPPPPDPEPNLVALQAPLVWEQGFTGQGVLVGTIDSGVLVTHPDLVNRIWSNPDEIAANGIDDDANGLIDDIQGWDFINGSNNVTSTDPHGTSTAGIAVGDGGGGKLTGMAPGAKLLVCEVLSQASYWLAQQYCVVEGVDVLTSSYSYKWADAITPDYHMFRQIADVELAAGVIHANSIGNNGQLQILHPIPFNIATPGNCPPPFAHPQVVQGGLSSVLACGGIQLPLDLLYNPSGRGPAAWEDITLYDAAYPYAQNSAYWDYPYGGFGGGQPGLIKPDLMGYASNVNTAAISTLYTIFGGTSAAAPHLGGALALLRGVQPEAEPRHLAAALEFSAADLGAAGKDNIYGDGKIQVRDAARRLLVLARVSDQTPSLGGGFTLDLFGPASAQLFGYFGAGIFDNPTAFNLLQPIFALGVVPLPPAGTATLPLFIPNDPILAGLTVWFQFGEKNVAALWGSGPLISVPESITITP